MWSQLLGLRVRVFNYLYISITNNINIISIILKKPTVGYYHPFGILVGRIDYVMLLLFVLEVVYFYN